MDDGDGRPGFRPVNRSEEDRFWSFVVKGPEPDDCWFWTDAISDDGYGRSWLKRDAGELAVRPERYAYGQGTGEPLPAVHLEVHLTVDERKARAELPERPNDAVDHRLFEIPFLRVAVDGEEVEDVRVFGELLV